MSLWNPWHGCVKFSPGCQNCYVYRSDEKYGRESGTVSKNADFDLPVRKNKNGEYKLRPVAGDTVFTCFTSDFLLDLADAWRDDAWRMMRERQDLKFLFITKRIDRFEQCIPSDWNDGYPNVAICVTVENQSRADYRLNIFKDLPIREKHIVCEPLLERIDISKYLSPSILSVTAGGESGTHARKCDFEWFLHLRSQCEKARVNFVFKQTGARFVKDGKLYRIPRKLQHAQAKKSGISFTAN